ncbi:MAG: phage baseplate assembly protein V [Novosphingobium aromaticivorans]|nr:phage baseplate assembly protein V [Novosphingobium aromaticivorans]
MMDGLMNQMRRAAQEAYGTGGATRHGIVDAYDPNAYAVKVTLQPDDTLTDWLPLKSPWVGNGWGLFCPPSIGDAIEIDFQEGDGGVGTAGWRFFNDEDRPLTVPSGEMWLVHRSGSSIKLANDGALTLDSGAGASIALKDGDITSVGNWAHTGKLTASDDVVAGGKSLKAHLHNDVQPGTGQSGPPA